MAKTKDKKKSKDKGGLVPVMFKGTDPDSNPGGGGNFAPRVKIKAGETVPVQFLVAPGDPRIVEIEEHQWQEKKKWFFVPCAGKKCPLCKDSDPDVAKTTYKVFYPVWDFKQKKAVLLSGPKTLRRIVNERWGKNDTSKKEFLKRTWDVSKVDGQPWWDVDRGDKKALNDKALKAAIKDMPDAVEHVAAEFEQFFGAKAAKLDSKASEGKGGSKKEKKKTSLDDEPYTKKGLKKLDAKKLVKIAEAFGMKKTKGLSDGDLIEFIIKKQG